MRNMLIISNSPLERDPRIQRQINTFCNDFSIETLGLTPANDKIKNYKLYNWGIVNRKRFTWQKVRIVLKMAFFNDFEELLYYRFCLKKHYEYKYQVPDIIIANDWDGLFLAAKLKNHFGWDAQIYFDAHEYAPKELDSFRWKMLTRPKINFVLKKYINEVGIMSTVCPSLARMYEKYFHFESNTVRVVTNAPAYEANLQPISVGNKIKIIHHGGALRARQIEKMIDMMAYLPEDKYELYFMLVLGDKEYYEELVQRASKYQNIHFLAPVPFAQIPSFTNQFDVGLFILNNDLINYKYALPNKFFEFVQARLAIAIGDSYEMKQYVKKYDLGIAADENTPEALADKFIKLTKEDIMKYKHNAHKYARELSAEPNMSILRQISEDLLS